MKKQKAGDLNSLRHETLCRLSAIKAWNSQPPALVGAKKGLLQAAQKDLEARRLSGNEAYGPFFSRLLDK
jgi:hypothetical protein